MSPDKTYRRHNSFTQDELDQIWSVRDKQTKEIMHLFPGRSAPVIDYLRRKTGALRIFSHGGTMKKGHVNGNQS